MSLTYEELYLKYYGYALRSARGITYNIGEAEDYAQEAMIKLMNEVKEGKCDNMHNERFHNWCMKVIKNKILDFGRSYYSNKNFTIILTADGDTGDVKASSEKSIAWHKKTEELYKDILKASKSLPKVQRKCFYRHYINQLSVTNIANILGVCEGTVKKALMQARKNIKHSMNEKGNGVLW